MKTIQFRRTRYTGHCWRSRDELINELLLCPHPHMDLQRQDDELGPTYNSSVPIPDVALKTCLNRWTTGKSGEKGSGRSVLMARHDDDGCCIFYYFFPSIWLPQLHRQMSKRSISQYETVSHSSKILHHQRQPIIFLSWWRGYCRKELSTYSSFSVPVSAQYFIDISKAKLKSFFFTNMWCSQLCREIKRIQLGFLKTIMFVCFIVFFMTGKTYCQLVLCSRTFALYLVLRASAVAS